MNDDIGQFYIYDYVYQITAICMWWFQTHKSGLGYLKYASVNVDDLPGWAVDCLLDAVGG